MLEEVDQKEKDTKRIIDAEIEAVRGKIFLLNLENTAEKDETMMKDTTMNTFEAMMDMKENINSNLSGDRNYLFCEYEPNEPLSALVGSLTLSIPRRLVQPPSKILYLGTFGDSG